MGFTLEQVVAMTTINPAKVINRIPKLGTLQMGAPAKVPPTCVGSCPCRLPSRYTKALLNYFVIAA